MFVDQPPFIYLWRPLYKAIYRPIYQKLYEPFLFRRRRFMAEPVLVELARMERETANAVRAIELRIAELAQDMHSLREAFSGIRQDTQSEWSRIEQLVLTLTAAPSSEIALALRALKQHNTALLDRLRSLESAQFNELANREAAEIALDRQWAVIESLLRRDESRSAAADVQVR